MKVSYGSNKNQEDLMTYQVAFSIPVADNNISSDYLEKICKSYNNDSSIRIRGPLTRIVTLIPNSKNISGIIRYEDNEGMDEYDWILIDQDIKGVLTQLEVLLIPLRGNI